MCQFLIRLSLVIILVGLTAAPVLAVKIKHQGSVYADATGLALKRPEGVACGTDSFLVADTENSRLVRYALALQGLTADAVFPVAKALPLVVQLNSTGEIYLLDGRTRTILKLAPDGQSLGKLEPQGVPLPQTLVPRSFKLDKKDNLYLLDIFSARVLVLNAAGEFLRQLPFPKEYGFFSDLAVDPAGAIYLLDSVAGALYLAAPGAQDFALLTAELKQQMNFPTSIAIDSKGILYLSDQYGSGLALVSRDGTFLGRKFGQGWEDGQLYYPSQLCINSQNTLVIADRNNSRVQVFNILDE